MLPSGTRLFKPHFKAREQMCAQQHQLRTQSFNSNKPLSAVSQGRGQISGLKKRLCLAIIILPNGAAMSPSWRYTAIEMFLWPASFNKGTWSHAAEQMSLHFFAANGRGRSIFIPIHTSESRTAFTVVRCTMNSVLRRPVLCTSTLPLVALNLCLMSVDHPSLIKNWRQGRC